MANVRLIQQAMRLMPLSAWQSGGEYTPPQGEHRDEYDVAPLHAVLAMNPQLYFNTANELMKTNPPAQENAEAFKHLGAFNIGAGLTFDVSVLQGDIAAE